MMDRKEETKKVKAALAAVGINARVGHGAGTSWGWLYVYVGSNPYAHLCAQHGPVGGCTMDNCLACNWYRTTTDQALKTAQETTGRKGDYQGRINIYTQ